MATEAPVDDDDAWLYGDNNSEDQRKEEINAIFDRATEDVGVPGEETVITTNGDIQIEGIENDIVGEGIDGEKGNEEEKDSDDDEDSDDDVQITIGDIKPSATTYPYPGAPVNLNIKRGGAFTGGAGGGGGKTKGIDLETVGLINGINIYEFNLDTIEDKPWRKPGADITDYFNYGFSEDSWKAYCEKQRKLRVDNNAVPKHLLQSTSMIPGKDQHIPIATVNENSKYSGIGVAVGAKKAGPPPGRRMSGSIDVICGATNSRRTGNAKENVIQVIGGYDNTLLPGLPPTHIPPPSFIPPNLSIPPPGLLPVPIPPSAIPGHVPFPDMYGNPIFTQPPPLTMPGDTNSPYDEQFFTGNSSSRQFDNNSESQQSWANSPHRERDRDRNRERDKDRDHYWEERRRERERRGEAPEDDYKRREDYERRRYRDYRERRDRGDSRYDKEYERDYEREREHYERDRDRDRDRERDSRERDRERRSHREHKEKDDTREKDTREKDTREKDTREKDIREKDAREKDTREKDTREKDRRSRRRQHPEEEERHTSSRHKHKKSKREKDDSSSNVVVQIITDASQLENKEDN